ncbi:MAG: c-type cytochrome [bacterium]
MSSSRQRHSIVVLRTLPGAALIFYSLNASAQQGQPLPFQVPAWAFPSISPEIAPPPPPFDSVTPLHVPKSTKAYTLAQVKNQFGPPDWHSSLHPAMPDIVSHGRRPATLACGYCHLPDGQGRSENATLAGLPIEYFTRQVADFRSGARHTALSGWGPSARMHDVAVSATDSEIDVAARYFARIRPTPRYKVVEASRIPLTYEAGGLYSARSDTGTQLLGTRIVEITTDLRRHEMRDATTTFVSYVPPGSIARGRTIATTSSAKPSTACVSCHGPALKGVGVVPPLAGRSPSYILRQLVGFRTGARASTASEPMQNVVAAMDIDDMIAVAAYAGSRRP